MDSSRYGGARVTHLRGGGSSVSGNCAQQTEHMELKKRGSSSKVDKNGAPAPADNGGNLDISGGAGIYGGEPYLRLGGAYASANAACSIICCVTGTHGADSDSDTPATDAAADTRAGATPAYYGGCAMTPRHVRPPVRSRRCRRPLRTWSLRTRRLCEPSPTAAGTSD